MGHHNCLLPGTGPYGKTLLAMCTSCASASGATKEVCDSGKNRYIISPRNLNLEWRDTVLP